jgi:hypothetical protein
VRPPIGTRAAGSEHRSKGANFVELLAGSIGTNCVVEVEGGGNRMRIQVKLSAAEVMSLVREWRDWQT